MHLQRRSNYSHVNHEQHSVEWESHGTDAFIDFQKFGNGSERYNWLRIVLEWEDIVAIVKEMADEKHEGALRIQKALRLADALEDFLKDSN